MRTNIVLQSEDISTTWINVNSTEDVNVAVAPDGTTTMDRLKVDTADAQHSIYQLITTVADANYAWSVFLKDDGAGFGGVVFGNGNLNHVSVVANLTTGVITATDVGDTSGTINSTSIESVGNGIFRLTVVGKHADTGSFAQVYASDTGTPTFDGGGRAKYVAVVGEDILIWGAQLEASSFPTPYIPTITEAVSRAEDPFIASPMTL